jgi:alpha-ketoglutaric semialdehyde dehydrogenase
MELVGRNLIGGEWSTSGTVRFRGVAAATQQPLDPEFLEATPAEVNSAFERAEKVAAAFAATTPAQRAKFLRAIADELVSLGTVLLERAQIESGLPLARLEGERGRTVGQLRLFADLLDEGSWIDARIDTGDDTRTPAPKPDLRRMLIPIGPVAVFGASNFPLAFSVAGGDTASALAAGCPVVFKAHPAHPGTSELAARAIDAAAKRTEMPTDVFSLMHGWSHEVGLAMVRHPLAQAVGFTGSLRGGRALFDAAAARPVPIPVYAEMGSINPVFLLPSALANSDALATGLAQSITMGVGQFCTNPGVVVAAEGQALEQFSRALSEKLSAVAPGVMLYDQLRSGYEKAVERATERGARRLTQNSAAEGRAAPALLEVSAERFADDRTLQEEMFGPVSVVVKARDKAELERVAHSLEGQLTATISGTAEELKEHANLVAILQRKVGRLLFNGFPTGVEVGHAMQHGGPYPASSDARTTSVGSAAIERFVRPICYQNFPEQSLPPELRNENPLGIMRMVNGTKTRDAVVG